MQRSLFLRTKLTSLNAFNGARVGVAIESDLPASIAAKYTAAKNAQPAWASTSYERRADCIRKFQSLLTENLDELASLMSEEMGKPVAHAKGEINNTIPRIQYFLDNVESVIADEEVEPESSGTQEIVRYEPIGVVGNISAWNFPYFVGSNVWIPALLTGNAVLYKPSEWTLQTGRRVAELMEQSGVPRDVFTPIYGDGAAGASLLEQPLAGFYFTGSSATGRKLAAGVFSASAMEKRASQNPHALFPRLQLELGGKDPVYIREDVEDAEGVGEGVADGAMFNAGQSCCSVERIYVHHSKFEDVVRGAVRAASSFKMGDPADPDTYLGPLAMPQQAAFLQSQVDDAVSKGAVIMCGGTREGTPTERFYPGTILTNVNHSMDIMKDESFGPIVGIMSVQNDDEAVQLMNDTSFGLTASVFTKSQEKAEDILSKVSSGTGYWNCCDRVSPASPWSGRNASGTGSTLSTAGVLAFVQPKAYHLRR